MNYTPRKPVLSTKSIPQDLIRWYVPAVPVLGQHLLANSWINKKVAVCGHSELSFQLKGTIALVIVRMSGIFP